MDQEQQLSIDQHLEVEDYDEGSPPVSVTPKNDANEDLNKVKITDESIEKNTKNA